MLTPDDLAAIRSLIREELAAPVVNDRVLTVPEAMAYVKKGSESAFYRWCARWHVTSTSFGRYAVSRLDSALDRETDRRRAKKPAPKPHRLAA